MKVQSIVVYLIIFFIAAPSFMAGHRQELPKCGKRLPKGSSRVHSYEFG
jgi:hypothetical protein